MPAFGVMYLTFFFFNIVLGKLVTMLRRPNKRKENWQCGRKGYETVSNTEEGRGFMMYNFRIPMALWRCLSTYHFYNLMFGGYGVFQWPAAAAKSLQLCPTLRPHRRQPTRLRCPWDSPGKNTGVGCHFLLHFSNLVSSK